MLQWVLFLAPVSQPHRYLLAQHMIRRKLTNKTPNLTSIAPSVKPHTAQDYHFTPQLNWQPLYKEALCLLPSSFPPLFTAPPVSLKRFGDLCRQRNISFLINCFLSADCGIRTTVDPTQGRKKNPQLKTWRHRMTSILNTGWATALSHVVQLLYFTSLTAGISVNLLIDIIHLKF